MGWTLVRQDTHGTRFDVASYQTESEAIAAMENFESGYPHHQTYYVEHRRGIRAADPPAHDHQVESLTDLLVVLTRLRASLATNPSSWENSNLEDFLEAMAAWVGTFPQPYINTGQSIPEPDWKLLADCLLAASSYE